MVEYRAELLLWVLANSLPLIMMGVWVQSRPKKVNFHYHLKILHDTFITVFFIRQLTVVWVAWDFEKEVVEGKLSPRLLQPIDPVWHHVAGHVAERFARLPFSLMLSGLLFYPLSLRHYGFLIHWQ